MGIVTGCGRCHRLWAVSPAVDSVTGCGQCHRLWAVLPAVGIVTGCGRCHRLWTVSPAVGTVTGCGHCHRLWAVSPGGHCHQLWAVSIIIQPSDMHAYMHLSVFLFIVSHSSDWPSTPCLLPSSLSTGSELGLSLVSPLACYPF